MEVTERTQQPPFICLKGNTSYIYDKFHMWNKTYYPFMHISFRAYTASSAFLYINIKIESLNPNSDLDLSRKKPSLVRDTSYVYGYF
jgi:hypothetical protein